MSDQPEIGHFATLQNPDSWMPYMPIAADLQPCPFCGEKAVLTDVRQSGQSFRVSCVNESCWRPGTDYYDTEATVVELWNRRAQFAATHAAIRALPRYSPWETTIDEERIVLVDELDPAGDWVKWEHVARLLGDETQP